jgi:hypothetical protein
VPTLRVLEVHGSSKEIAATVFLSGIFKRIVIGLASVLRLVRDRTEESYNSLGFDFSEYFPQRIH